MSRLINTYYKLLTFITPSSKLFFAKTHFQPQADPNKAALLFKKSVRTVEIEISSYCNRICSYCPNVFIDRRTAKEYMDDDVFLNIVDALSRINYSNIIRLNRYNEPLADLAYYMKRMKQVRKRLPNAKFEIYSNGDYFKHDVIEELYENGCRSIHATAHHDWPEYSQEKAERYLTKLIDKLGYTYTIVKNQDNATTCEVHVRDDMRFTYDILDFMADNGSGNILANDRGQSLDIQTNYKRTSPCMRQFAELSIDYNGKVVPCCHIRSDIPAHENYIMGEITKDSDIFLLWGNHNFSEWRKSMVNYELKAPPCTTCDYLTVGENKKIRHWGEYVKSLDK